MTRRLPTRDLALVAVFAALIAALGAIPGFTPPGMSVPITAQTLGVMLAGAVLGARRGALAVVTFLALVAVGLPLLSNARGGLHWLFASPSEGFLWGWIPGAFVVGALVERRPRRWSDGWIALACAVGGIGVVYAVGVPVMAWQTSQTVWHSVVVSAVYLPGDVVKVVVATVVTSAVLRGYPEVLATAGRDRVAATAGHVGSDGRD